jgi:elongation factor P
MAEIQARELRPGMNVLLNGKICKVLTSEHTGTGKLSHKTYATFRTIPDDRPVEKTFHPDDKLPLVDLERKKLAFSYRDGEQMVFLDNQTFDEHRIAARHIAQLVPFLKEDTEVEAEFLDGNLVGLVMPEFVQVRVESCAPALLGIDATTPKTALLENGLEVLVPQFIEPGDTIRIAVATHKYIERVQNKK